MTLHRTIEDGTLKSVLADTAHLDGAALGGKILAFIVHNSFSVLENEKGKSPDDLLRGLALAGAMLNVLAASALSGSQNRVAPALHHMARAECEVYGAVMSGGLAA
jgi:hypothetical protein